MTTKIIFISSHQKLIAIIQMNSALHSSGLFNNWIAKTTKSFRDGEHRTSSLIISVQLSMKYFKFINTLIGEEFNF